MKKVVDSSALRSPILTDFLTASQTNIVIVTDRLAMELFKGEGKTNIHHSLRILARFPRQVVVLKSLPTVLKIRPRQTGLHSRLIDEQQTTGFRRYCQILFSGSWTEAAASRDRLRKQLIANRTYDRGKNTVEKIRTTIDRLKRSYSKDELKSLRRKGHMSDDFWKRFVDDVFDGTIAFFHEVLGAPTPSPEALQYSYPFRYTLCAYARAIDWIAEGGYESAPPEKLANDYTDMAYAAYSTFFDGLLTEDKKLDEINAFATRMYRRVFLKAFEASAQQD